MIKTLPDLPNEELEAARHRFMGSFERGDPGQCWPWKRSACAGYGIFCLNGRRYIATRVMMYLRGARITENSLICHRCNNRICVNPDHLYVGDAKSNAADSLRAGTFVRASPGIGEKHCNARLTKGDVLRIRNHKIEGISLRSLAKQLGVSSGTVTKVWRGDTWSHV